MVSKNKTLPITILLLRLLIFIFLLISIIVLATDKLTLPGDASLGTRTTTFHFKDVYAYRYVLSVAVIGCAYTLLQIPFAAYYVSTGKQLAGDHDRMLQLFICCDMVFALLFATGVGAGFGLTVDVKRLVDEIAKQSQALGDNSLVDSSKLSDTLSKISKFLDLANVSAGFLLLATVCMAILTMSLALVKK